MYEYLTYCVTFSNIRKQGPPMRNGKVDSLDRSAPIDPPEITDRILQLAAVKAY